MKGGFCLARRRWVPAKGKQNERKQNRNFQKIKSNHLQQLPAMQACQKKPGISGR
jgi:hypothetical protein